MINLANKIFAVAFVFFITASFASAQEKNPETAFKNIKDIPQLQISVPTVIEVPMNPTEIDRGDFLIYNTTTKVHEPHYFLRDSRAVETDFKVDVRDGYTLSDNDTRTFAEFLVPLDKFSSEVVLNIVGAKPITSSGINLQLDNHVAYPTTVEITAITESGEEKRIVTRKRLTSTNIQFPKITAIAYKVTLTHSQLLRITEINFVEHDKDTQITHGVRFLAQPGNTYQLYYNPDRYMRADVGESGNLRGDEGVKVTPYTVGSANVLYTEADVDEDGVADRVDNCVTISNREQTDIDNSGKGDACEDFDRDGQMNTTDNCPDIPNRYQRDEDGDGIGDECDGEESRLTERHAWVPWVGMGIAALVMFFLFFIAITSAKKSEIETVENEDSKDDNQENLEQEDNIENNSQENNQQ